MSQYDVQDFERDVIERSRQIPVLVDFWAAWCGPCRVLGPVLERLAGEADGRWQLAKLDTEAHPEISARYGIRSIPACKLFVDGEVLDEFVGALPEPTLRQWLERAIPGPARGLVTRARARIEEDDAEGARDLLEEALEIEPGNDEARVLLARLDLFGDPAAALDRAEAVSMGSAFWDEAAAIADLARLLQRTGPVADLPEGRGRDAFVAGLRALQARDLPTALDRFIETIALDRSYADDAARHACLAIFRILGEEHPVTRSHRVAFGNAVMA